MGSGLWWEGIVVAPGWRDAILGLSVDASDFNASFSHAGKSASGMYTGIRWRTQYGMDSLYQVRWPRIGHSPRLQRPRHRVDILIPYLYTKI